MQAKIKLMHECFVLCSKCNGSGEGMYDGSRGCTDCRGRGILLDQGEPEDEMEVEWTLEDLSDLEIIDGYDDCEHCGRNMVEIAKEELRWKLKNEKN